MCDQVYCNTCCQVQNAPYRWIGKDGKVIEGCVDDFHSPAMPDDEWHNRPSAKAYREKMKERKAKLLGQ